MERMTESPLALYQAHLEKGELAYQWSPEAGKAVFYPRVICPFTGSDRLEWRVSAGLGTVYATTVTHPREGAPYNVALIDCDEGFRLMSRVEDIAPEAVQIGMRVRFRVHRPGGDEPPYPVFVPAGDGVMDGLQRGSAAIVGVAESDLGAVAEEMSPIDLMAQGIQRALADCGLQLRDVDGLFCATTQSRTSGLASEPNISASRPPLSIRRSSAARLSCFMSRMRRRRCSSACARSRSSPMAAPSARSAAVRPRCANTIPTRRRSGRFCPRPPMRWRPRATCTNTARPASNWPRSRWRRGEWALLNPAAWEKKPLTIDEVLSARMVSYPFTVRDCCLVTDGGGAVIMTTAERARSLKKPPVYVLGCGQAITHANISSMPDLTVTGALQSGRAAYEMARLAPGDIDVVELYDAFTINTILFLEDLGFCPKGEGGPLRVDGGRIAPGGGSAGQHQWRRPLLLPSRHVRPVPADRGGAAAARRMRRAPGRRLRDRDRARQWRRAVVAEHGHPRNRGDDLRH